MFSTRSTTSFHCLRERVMFWADYNPGRRIQWLVGLDHRRSMVERIPIIVWSVATKRPWSSVARRVWENRARHVIFEYKRRAEKIWDKADCLSHSSTGETFYPDMNKNVLSLSFSQRDKIPFSPPFRLLRFFSKRA